MTGPVLRRAMLLAALVATVWLAYRAPPLSAPHEMGIVEAVKPAARPAESLPVRRRQELQPANSDPFNPAAPKPRTEPRKVAVITAPPPPPAPAPTAPPLPFTYFGLVADAAGANSVFVAQGSTLLSIRRGLVIDGQYRVEKIDAGEIIFTYLPMGLQQSLRIPQ